jgi:eukaryotic-like serine/threonine-protein kinase
MAGETLLNGRYQLVAQQGSGGMAVIYKAVDRALGRTVAVKILRPSLTSDPAFLTRFRNEARAVANLSHPNIVTVHDVGSDGPTHYIVMEYVEGQDLKKIIRAVGALSVERALNLAIQICAGIGFAHRANLVHADVKPQNILVTRDDVVKVTDFGIAQALSDTQPGQVGEKQAVVWGSPHYFAPEQAKGDKPTPSSDVYAIGIVMFEMFTGRLPYMGANQQELAMAHIRDRIPLVSEFNPAVPESLARIVYKVMSKEPAARYRMADQLGHVLLSYRDQGRQQTAAGPMVNPPQSPAPRPAAPTLPGQSAGSPPNSGVQISPPLYPQQAPAEPRPAEPTQRYSPAPVAPQSAPPARPLTPPVAPGQPYQQAPMPPQPTGNTGRFYTQRYETQEDVPPSLDVVTIALAVLAFFAVACLIPLYIAVFQAQGG